MSIPLLSTKLHIPSSRAYLVPRPRLSDLLEASKHAKLTLVSAPAGYGKSTLVSEWLHQSRLSVAWLSIDTNDNNLKRLVTYIIAAIRTAIADFGQLTLALLETPQPSRPDTILTVLVNELNDIRAQIALVLDDYHLITERSIHEAIAFLLEHLPPFVHLLILTRSDPAIPIARLRAQDQLVEIRADDLRFSAEEATAFINSTMGLALSPDMIHALEERTEGWITGLQLAALSMQDLEVQQLGEFIAAFTGGHHYIVDYLLEEVLNRQPGPVREFLLRTSILERMTGGLCDALTGESDGQITLERLEQRNLFIVPLDDQRQWYRYHNLLADVLQSRLQQSRPESLPELHRRASGWFENNGFLEQAIRHAVAGKDIEKAAELIEQNAMTMLMRGELVTLLNWIKPIEHIAGERPWLSTYKSWALTLTGQLDIAEDWLHKAERAIPLSGQESRHELKGHIEAIRAYIAEAHGEPGETIGHAQKALGYLPESNQAVRSVVTFTLATAYRLTGDYAQATQALKTARLAGRTAGNRYLELGAVFTLADLTFDQGRLHQAFDIYQETLQLAARPGGQKSPAAGMAYFGLGLIYYEWNDLDAAEANTQQAIDLCQNWGHFVNLAASFVLLSRLKQAQGDLDGAQQAIHSAEELTRIHALALRAESWVKAFGVRLWLAQGNLEAATRWAEESGITIADEFSYLREAEYFTLGRVYLEMEKYDQVLELTRWLGDAAEATGRIGSLIETLVLRALAFQAKNNFPQALFSLESALSLAQPEGYIRVFVNEGTPMAELLRRAGSQGIGPKFIAKLLSEFDQDSEGADSTDQPLIEPLSKRELEVLNLLADGLSNSDIADRCVITVGTVKAHTASIYRKLNVNSRTQAVARARELELL
ncbi:MAG: LuxR C-terminal-related transcriptional regulator [Anaerolineales bacterium]|jgi:LuxR family maltose regulon positive regulatory protein